MGSAGLTCLSVTLFLCLFRPPKPEETPLLPESSYTSLLKEKLVDSVEQGLVKPQDKGLKNVSRYQQIS